MKLLASVILLMLAGSALAASATGPSYRIQVDGLACPFCAYGIEKELNRIEQVARVETHIRDGVVVVTMAPGATLEESRATQAINEAGFTPRGLTRVESGPAEP